MSSLVRSSSVSCTRRFVSRDRLGRFQWYRRFLEISRYAGRTERVAARRGGESGIDPVAATGKPCIRNLRFPVSRLLGLLAAGETKESILKAHLEDRELLLAPEMPLHLD